MISLTSFVQRAIISWVTAAANLFVMVAIADEPGPQQPQLTLAARDKDEFGLLTLTLDGEHGKIVTRAKLPLAEPAWSPDGRKLAFVSFENGPGQICVLDVETQQITKLTKEEDWERNPSWSPDGRKIAFTSRRTGADDIFIMNSDGSEQVNLTNNPGYEADPTWSPDGKRIAFACYRDDKFYRLFVMNADGSEQQPFSERLLPGWLFPDWSPDGKWIVVGEQSGTGVNLLLFNVEKKTFADLYTEGGCNSFARWSPDGRYIAFAHFASPPPSYRRNDPVESMPLGDLMVFDGDNSIVTVLAKNAVPGWGPRPSWKPVTVEPKAESE